jgi:hypothetical protein
MIVDMQTLLLLFSDAMGVTGWNAAASLGRLTNIFGEWLNGSPLNLHMVGSTYIPIPRFV